MIFINGENSQIAKSIKFLHKGNFNYLNRTRLDLSNNLSIESFFKKNSLEIFINCAAYTNVNKAEEEKTKSLQINSNSLEIICYYCKKFNINLLHFSSDYIFDGKKNNLYQEDDKPNPINYYGYTKHMSEIIILSKLKNYKIFRTSGIFSFFKKNILLTILKKSKEENLIKLVVDQTSSPTSSYEIAKFLIYILSNKEYLNNNGIYNLVSSDNLSWYEYGILVKKIFKLKRLKIEEINLSEFNSDTYRPINSALSMDKTQKAFKYNFPSIEKSLMSLKILNEKY